ncbi:hypothetical protein ACQKWADRAFT_328838 [Trichoderma austrokoningii]
MGSVATLEETRSIINIIEDDAASNPNRPFVFVPRSTKPQDGWEPITYRQITNAANHVAHIIAQMVANDPRKDDFPTVGYIGPNDVRYLIVMLACMKAKCQPFLPSPRNTIEGQLSLIKATDCRYFWYGEGYLPVIQKILAEQQLEVTQVPNAKEWLEATPSHFPYNHSALETRSHPWIALHTSGSTGIPKKIVICQANLQLLGTFRNVRDQQNNPSLYSAWASRSTRVFNPMPLFHAAGLGMLMMLTVNYKMPCALNIPEKPLNTELVMQSLAHAGVDGALLPPSVIEDVSSTKDGLKALANLNFLSFGGGSLSGPVGDKLVDNGAYIINLYGASENFPLALQEQTNPRLWQYFVFNPELIGAEMVPTAWEGIYGFKIRRNPRDAGLQPVFNNFPDTDEFLTGDLFQAHEFLPNNYKYYGRNDNVIVFSNGEKLNPVTIEDIVVAHPALKHVLVVGQRKFQPAIILEPKKPLQSDAEAEALINDVWPLIEQANKQTVAHGRIVRQLVAISDPHLPFLLAGKGTVQRIQTVRLYEDYIESIYSRADATVNDVNLDLSSQQALASSINEMLQDKLGIEQLQQDTDFFSHGVDSLQVISMAKMLQAGLENSGIEFDPSIVATRSVYANPSVELLSGFIFRSITKTDEESSDSAEAEFSAQQIKAMEAIVAKYTSNLPKRNDAQKDPNETSQKVILTGSTGSLGSYMLDQLINSPRVSKVYALNRGADGGRSRQEDITANRILSKDFSKVEFLSSDLSKPNFGLESAKYAEMLSSVDRIVHNAWPVNFNMPITSFEPFIRGVRHFVDFAGASPKKVAFAFVSSIGTASNWTSSEPVPERRLDDPSLAEMGYGLSKLAASFILDAAAAQSGLATISVRVGQIAGPHNGGGVWNPQEFVPSLIASSVHLGVLPSSLGPFQNVDWVPTEDVSGIILDVAGITNSAPIADINGYFHVQNPARVQWSEVANFLKEFYGGRIRELSSFGEWLSALESSASDEQSLDKNPAVKLLDTYRAFREKEEAGEAPVVFDMKRTISRSTTAATLKPIDTDLLRKWCTSWNF